MGKWGGGVGGLELVDLLFVGEVGAQTTDNQLMLREYNHQGTSTWYFYLPK